MQEKLDFKLVCNESEQIIMNHFFTLINSDFIFSKIMLMIYLQLVLWRTSLNWKDIFARERKYFTFEWELFLAKMFYWL